MLGWLKLIVVWLERLGRAGAILRRRDILIISSLHMRWRPVVKLRRCILELRWRAVLELRWRAVLKLMRSILEW